MHVVSHELRSTLWPGCMWRWAWPSRTPRRLSATLERIELEAKRLDKMVGEVLTLARAESGSPATG